MAKAIYTGVDNVARKVTQSYVGVNGVSRKVKSGYAGVENVARQCLSGGTPISESGLAVGDSVFVNVDGVATEFIIVQMGLPSPSSPYDWVGDEYIADGVWLLSKDIMYKDQFNTAYSYFQNNSYTDSDLDTYVNGNGFLGLLDVNIQNIIKYVTIPIHDGVGNSGSTQVVGVTRKIFILSYTEVGAAVSNAAIGGYEVFVPSNDGSALEYFKDGKASDRIAYYNSTATAWLTRTPPTDSDTSIWQVSASGNVYANGQASYLSSSGVRPAFIIPSDTLVDSNFNVIA